MTQLTNKVVWITGASGGIGEGLALAAAARGAKLILTARRESELARVRQACPRFVKTNVSINALGPDGKAFGELDPDIGKGMAPSACAERIWLAVERDQEEVMIAGKERIAVYFKRFLPLSLYTAFARRLKVN